MSPSEFSTKQILLTGATGFVGSALAAAFLSRGGRVVAVSRNDPSGERTARAIAGAADGFGTPLPSDALQHLTTLSLEPARLEEVLDRHTLSGITDVWHCAANMTYALETLEETLETNLVMATRLYQLVAERSSSCSRFYQVSTAYTAGIERGHVAEELHFAPRLVNAYQMSKWCTEQALAHLAASGPALTIFRPTIVVGHRHTGWSTRKPFGYYMFVNAAHHAARRGIREFTFHIDPAHTPHLISIDDVVEAATALTARSSATARVEVLHCATEPVLTTSDHAEIIGRTVGITVRCGEPRTSFDHLINRKVMHNREFAFGRWSFDCSAMCRALGVHRFGVPLTNSEVGVIVARFAGASASTPAAELAAATVPLDPTRFDASAS
jgi:nucleoside-diphosphate-sugar epimerase